MERDANVTRPREEPAIPPEVSARYPADMICDNGHRWRADVVSRLNYNGTEDEAGRDPANPTEGVPCPQCGGAGHLL